MYIKVCRTTTFSNCAEQYKVTRVKAEQKKQNKGHQIHLHATFQVKKKRMNFLNKVLKSNTEDVIQRRDTFLLQISF